MKFDLVMWTYNGERTLKQVLERIDKVVPAEFVNQRFVVDDCSTDGSVEVARSCGWTVFVNDKNMGIGFSANRALGLVKSEWFVSFEQDVLVDADWFNVLSSRLRLDGVVVVSGVRYSDKPKCVNVLERFSSKDGFFYGKSLDNTFYNTAFLRGVGGFPVLGCGAGVDTVLAVRVFEAGKVWFVEGGFAGVHLRRGFGQCLRHSFWYGFCLPEIKKACGGKFVDGFWGVFLRCLFSPVRGLMLVVRSGCWWLLFVYPLLRWANVFGQIKGMIVK